MSRLTDVRAVLPHYQLPALPAVDWASIGHTGPQPVQVDYQGPEAPLPAADVAVLTWTSAEWSAFDQVFMTSDDAHVNSSWSLERSWHLYSKDAGAAASVAPLWGYYQLVDVAGAGGKTVRALLFKCDSHLAHPPWIDGLVQMIEHILADASPKWIYSIGTAGGSRLNTRLGDVVVTNAGHIELKKPENAGVPIGGQTFTGGAFPATGLFDAVRPLFFDLRTVVTPGALASAIDQVHYQVPDSSGLDVPDMLNAALAPDNLYPSEAVPMPGTPLLTTDYYYIASGADADQWAVLEMDDAVIAYVAGKHGTSYVFVRNISDPVVPTQTASGTPIPDDARDSWSSQIYQGFGLFTSFNGALTTWAAIAG
jgi:Phosphorylase superfamily